jgi:hypothetical protein
MNTMRFFLIIFCTLFCIGAALSQVESPSGRRPFQWKQTVEAAPPQSDCEKMFQRARLLYEQGKLEAVAETLSSCAFARENSRPLRREILTLLVETHLFLDQKQSADKAYLELLKMDPFFKPDSRTVVPEMEYIDADFETFPLTTWRIYGGLSLFTLPNVSREFSLANTTVQEENYYSSKPDISPASTIRWLAGLEVNYNLFKSNFEISLGYMHSLSRFRYQGVYTVDTPAGILRQEIDFQEKHRWSHFPVLVTLNLRPMEDIIQSTYIPYVQLGGSLDVLHLSTSEIFDLSSLFLMGPDTLTLRVDAPFSLDGRRQQLNFSLVAGIGAKIHLKRFFLDLNLRYQRVFFNLVNEDRRFEDSILTQRHYYVDNDFSMRRLGVSLGVGWFFFKSRMK